MNRRTQLLLLLRITKRGGKFEISRSMTLAKCNLRFFRNKINSYHTFRRARPSSKFPTRLPRMWKMYRARWHRPAIPYGYVCITPLFKAARVRGYWARAYEENLYRGNPARTRESAIPRKRREIRERVYADREQTARWMAQEEIVRIFALPRERNCTRTLKVSRGAPHLLPGWKKTRRGGGRGWNSYSRFTLAYQNVQKQFNTSGDRDR